MRLRLLGLLLLLALPAGALAANGERLYGRYCAMCHAPDGSGQTNPARLAGYGPAREWKIQPGVGPPLLDSGAQGADFYLRTGYMPLQRNGLQPRRSRLLLGESELRALVAYVASLGSGPPIPKPQPQRGSLSEGQALFRTHCAGCHQIVAEGGYVTHAVPPPLKDATPTQIAEAVRIGPYVMPRFSPRALSNAQLDSIVAYVQWAKHPDDRGGWALGHVGPVPEGLVTWFLAAAALVAVCLVIGRRLRA
jgi:ubiquinol-cytochrome c reductase cytochrome c subunit